MTIRDRLGWLARLVRALATRLEPVAPLLTRLVLGWAFLRTGYGKLTQFADAVAFFGAVGIPFPRLGAALVTTLELAGGALLCLGLGTRSVAVLLSFTMVVATLTADRAQLFGSFAAGSGYGPIEVVPLLFLLFLLWLAADGGGLVSLDRLLARARPAIGEAEAERVLQRSAATAVRPKTARRWWRLVRQPDLLAPHLRSVAALATRVLVGYAMLRAGIGHASALEATAQSFANRGVPLPAAAALLLAGLESVGGLGILVGLGTRVLSLSLGVVMTVVLATTERARLVEAVVPGGELWVLEVVPLVLLMLFAWLAIRGAGRLALDPVLATRFRGRHSARRADAAGSKRIVILGGGFGGMYAAMELERIFADDPGVHVTLVNQDNFLLFTPMLHEVAASDLDVTHIVCAARKLLTQVEFVNGEVQGIDLGRREVTLAHGDAGLRHVLRYDHLVLGLGSVTNFHGVPGLAEGAYTMRTIGDAIALRNRLIGNMEAASVVADANERARLLTFVVAGGGFAGVETVAAINDFARETRRFYPALREGDIRMVLVHSGDRILPELSPQLGDYARNKLTERGVEVRLQTRVKGLGADGATLGDGTVLPTRTLVWTAGTAPHPLLATLPCAKEKGRVVVDATLAVPSFPGLWSLGDCAVVPDLARGGSCPPTAQHATRQGRVLAGNIAAALRGQRARPFRFRMLGQLAALGRRSGVAQILGLRFSGFVAWWLWRSIYLLKLPGFERKVRVALDWTLDLLFTKDLVKCPTDRGPRVPAAPPKTAPAGELEPAGR
ncbi:MAG: FAD-dependent oxidoreductase [Planctomycetes bacterium]|nr:FAD-dependent oxidoreductase [Planctomycetota bacterium]